MGIAYTIHYFGVNYADASVLQHISTNIYLWFAILAILGCAKAWFDKTSRFASYMAKSSFGIYIVHYLVVLVICYFLKAYAPIPVLFIYIISIAGVLLLSPAIYELLRRIPVIRYLMFGMKKKKSS